MENFVDHKYIQFFSEIVEDFDGASRSLPKSSLAKTDGDRQGLSCERCEEACSLVEESD